MNDNPDTRMFTMEVPNGELQKSFAKSNDLSRVINVQPVFHNSKLTAMNFCCHDQVIGTYTFGQDGAGKEMRIHSIEWVAESNEVAVTYVL